MTTMEIEYRTDNANLDSLVSTGAFGYYIDRDLTIKAFDPRIITEKARKDMGRNYNIFHSKEYAMRALRAVHSVMYEITNCDVDMYYFRKKYADDEELSE